MLQFKNHEFIYAGNRSTVLRQMLDLGLNVTLVLPLKSSRLEQEMPLFSLPYLTVESKAEAVSVICNSRFDVFVSTGFPFILPITRIRHQHPKAVFVNVHPSFLPDLRGADPIPGAIIHGRDSGATCHLMDDGIDTGPIIAQVKLPYSPLLDSELLYNLCFKLEPQVFKMALQRAFRPKPIQNSKPNLVYYSFKESDRIMRLSESDTQTVARVRAFNTHSKGVRFMVDSTEYLTFGADILPITTPFEAFSHTIPNTVTAIAGSSIIIAKPSTAIRFHQVKPPPHLSLLGHQLVQIPI